MQIQEERDEDKEQDGHNENAAQEVHDWIGCKEELPLHFTLQRNERVICFDEQVLPDETLDLAERTSVFIDCRRISTSATKTSDLPNMVSPTAMIMENTREAQIRDNLLKTLVNVYEAEISRLNSMVSKDPLSSHRAKIKDEIKVLEGLCNNNIRDSSAQEAYENITLTSSPREVPFDS
ncbi:hypothetical protein OS493_012253 [Desmophyllum pertusum]|uniref:Uncharacterized protein n=1 Tax=Desmophyllum pertusum TaxID=174260 RepID=A0A9W9ZR16_9CNID|nr:hypothetical protein OS493_012253 [Desmophyllum pertusum]